MSPEQQRAIDNPRRLADHVASRVCLDLLRSARVRRERYVGEWIPEPLPEPAEWAGGRSGGSGPADPADRVTLDESVSMAFLVVLESMTPAERVAFILHDVFRYPFAEIAEIVGRTPAACRQLASSARRRMSASQAPVRPRPQQAGVVRAFKRAWEAGDIQALSACSTPTPSRPATVAAGQCRAAPDRGRRAGRPLLRRAAPPRRADPAGADGQRPARPGGPARDGVTVTVFAFEVVGDRIQHIWAVLEPGQACGTGRPDDLTYPPGPPAGRSTWPP